MRERSVTSASSIARSSNPRSCSSSCWMLNRLSSACSTSTSFDGCIDAICRLSSEPIDPPAPVTSTTWPVRYAAMPCRSTSIGSRPSTSSTRTSRIWLASVPASPPPSMSSCIDGRIRTFTFAARHFSTTRRTSEPGALGIAMMTSSAPASAACSATSSVRPSTGTPRIRMSCLRASSSTRPIGTNPSGWRCDSRTSRWPALPAPAISTRVPPWSRFRAGPPTRVGRSKMLRASRRRPHRNATEKPRSYTSTERGMSTACSGGSSGGTMLT